MSITLRSETERRIADHMQAGRYASAEEVVEAGLTLLERRQRRMRRDQLRLKRKIDRGLRQLDQGHGIDGEQALEQLLAELGPADR